MSAPTASALFGKAPWHDEFLRPSRAPSRLRSFDEWLFRNAHAVKAYPPLAASYGFLIQLREADRSVSGIVGVIAPSCDRAGRAYPIAIASGIDFPGAVGAHAEVAPIVLESYWQSAMDLLSDVRAARPAATDERIHQLLTDAEPPGTALDLYEGWARRTLASELCTLLDRPAGWLTDAAQAIGALAVGVGGKAPSAETVAVRVPLGRAAGAALCFWLDLMRRVARWYRQVPSFFWSHDEQTGEALLFLGDPGETALTTLWQIAPPPHPLCDLTPVLGRASAHPSYHPLPTSSTDATLWSILERVDAGLGFT